MNINVLLSSGTVDEWEDAGDAVETPGGLAVLYHIDSDEVPGDMKTMRTVEELDEPPAVGRLTEPVKPTKTTVWQVAAVYAPGMWMRVEFKS